jgi:hypothetical protein
MTLICKAVEQINPEFKGHLKPMCEYLHECPEFKSCGYWKHKLTKEKVENAEHTFKAGILEEDLSTHY